MRFLKSIFQRKRKNPAIGLALSGGATHGAAHIGVLQVLEQEGIKPSYVAGTSAGALIGAAYCAGVPVSEIERLFLGLEWPDLLRLHIRPRLSFFDAQPLETFLKTEIGDLTFTDLQIPFACIACDITTGERVVLDKGPLGIAIRASSAFPALFPPVELDGRLLIDGGIIDNLPVEQVRAMGAKIVISSDVSKRGRKEKTPENPIEVLMSAIYIMQDRSAYFNTDDCDICIRPELSEYSAWGFKDSQKMLDAGREAAEKVLPDLRLLLKNNKAFPIRF
jgi:NTE family protein